MPVWTGIIIKSLGAIIFLFTVARILGKKQIAQLTFFEYITGITLGELAGFISTDIENNFGYGIVALFVWTLVPLSMEFISLRSKTVRNWLQGKETVVIQQGKVLESNLKKERYSADELLQQLRGKNAFKVADVEFAVLEANGELSVLMKKEHQPITPANLGVKIAPEREAQTIIMDGVILDEPLTQAGLNRGWLSVELEKRGILVDNVFIGQVDSYGILSVDLFDDRVPVNVRDEKAVLLATLNKCAAEFQLFALMSANQDARNIYDRAAKQLAGVIEEIKPCLRSY